MFVENKKKMPGVVAADYCVALANALGVCAPKLGFATYASKIV